MSGLRLAEGEKEKAADDVGSQNSKLPEEENEAEPLNDKAGDEKVDDAEDVFEQPQGEDQESIDDMKNLNDDEIGSRISDPERYPGKNKDSFCTTERSKLKDLTISLFDLKNVRLQFIYNMEEPELLKSFLTLKMTVEPARFK